MQKTCSVTGEAFVVEDLDLALYKRLGVPVPTLCPTERQRRRISFRNFRSLYHRPCSGSGKQIISMYHAEQPFPVYETSFWYGDSWDGLQYGREFDFSRTFFEQYAELADVVPRSSIATIRTENCEYSNLSLDSKNCYLVFGCVYNQDCLYGHIVWSSENCIDNLYAFRCQWSSNSIDIVDCYDTHYSQEATNCKESYFLFDCANCRNCFGCTNLRNKQYYFLNQPLSKGEYQQKLDEVLPLSYTNVERFSAWLAKERESTAVVPATFGISNEEVSGNHLYETRQMHWCFDVKKAEKSSYCFTTLEHDNVIDQSFGGAKSSFCVDCLTATNSHNTIYSHTIVDSYDLAYSEFCFSSRNLFGCNGLRNKQYCILNKQYSEHEYKALREKIIEHMTKAGEWGEFFPMSLSPFAYNEAIVGEYLPLSEEEIVRRGSRLRPEAPDVTESEKKTSQHGVVPDQLNNAGEELSKQRFSCRATGKAYRVLPQEITWSKRLQIPLSPFCPDERHLRRMAQREPRRLWPAQCHNCDKPLSSAFSPKRYPRILCEACYLQKMY